MGENTNINHTSNATDANVDDQANVVGGTFLLSVADRLRQESYDDAMGWWKTPTASVIVDLAKAAPFVAALAGIAEVLQEGEEPMWVVGGTTASAAFVMAQEWLNAGVDPYEVGSWLRAGCWDPKAARRMVEVGLRPSRLLNEDGKPAHWVDSADGEVPVALAVADSFLTAEEAVRVVVSP